jgi:hypothetical protein
MARSRKYLIFARKLHFSQLFSHLQETLRQPRYTSQQSYGLSRVEHGIGDSGPKGLETACRLPRELG